MAIDVEPKLLEITAVAAIEAYDKAVGHVNEEIKARDPSNLTALIGSLAPDGPYAYTIMPRILPDGTISLPVLSTREEITEAYTFIRGLSDVHEVAGLTEITGSWYLFQDSLTVGSPKDTDVRNDRHTLGIFPIGSGAGHHGRTCVATGAPVAARFCRRCGSRRRRRPARSTTRARPLSAVLEGTAGQRRRRRPRARCTTEWPRPSATTSARPAPSSS